MLARSRPIGEGIRIRLNPNRRRGSAGLRSHRLESPFIPGVWRWLSIKASLRRGAQDEAVVGSPPAGGLTIEDR
jgi:hypothetical protein